MIPLAILNTIPRPGDVLQLEVIIGSETNSTITVQEVYEQTVESNIGEWQNGSLSYPTYTIQCFKTTDNELYEYEIKEL